LFACLLLPCHEKSNKDFFNMPLAVGSYIF
jgi:hypothetical protein